MLCQHDQGERWPKHSREVLLVVRVDIVIETVQRMKQHSHILCGYNSRVTLYTGRTKHFSLGALTLLSQSIVFVPALIA